VRPEAHISSLARNPPSKGLKRASFRSIPSPDLKSRPAFTCSSWSPWESRMDQHGVRVKKKNAVGFVDCGARRKIQFIPEIASKKCHSGKECFSLCPTSYLQAAFVLAEAFCKRLKSQVRILYMFPIPLVVKIYLPSSISDYILTKIA
jgi:hypothetical protein